MATPPIHPVCPSEHEGAGTRDDLPPRPEDLRSIESGADACQSATREARRAAAQLMMDGIQAMQKAGYDQECTMSLVDYMFSEFEEDGRQMPTVLIPWKNGRLVVGWSHADATTSWDTLGLIPGLYEGVAPDDLRAEMEAAGLRFPHPLSTGPILGPSTRIYTCDQCGEEYAADAPSAAPCPLCPMKDRLDRVRESLQEVEAYRVIEALSLDDLQAHLNLAAAAGFRAARIDPPDHCTDCGGGTGHVMILARTEYDRDAHVERLKQGDAVHAEIEAARLSVPAAIRGAPAS